ncbi:NAD/NADP octopine/nopaline dehydrogenase family protein [Komagataeibacter xylinus]|uniref:Glycerol-3-phosphate dehydrogenase n=1 Tax=Komagataeibacter xylinus TaxID=28448 RepID=A0A857FP95_KOMXY|nr:NAD/NADP octopine/nopaline dehydrogenase family protein [Komagataeibacter xylinus]QHC36002.1 glycerol-3-phosphate dehydrogenase [Komagataeibacter xylinus]
MSNDHLDIAVLGGGNGGFAAAADLARQGHRIRLWRHNAEQVSAHNAHGNMMGMRDASGQHEVKIDVITGDMAEAIRGAAVILVVAPAFAQETIGRTLAPHLTDGQVVYLPPGTLGSVLFAHYQHMAGNPARTAFAETGTLPWLARKYSPYGVTISGRATRLPTGVFPRVAASWALERLGHVFPGVIEDCGDALSGALMNAGPIIHPPLIIMNAGPLEHFPAWDIHAEGTQPAIRRVTDALDHERIALRAAMGYAGPHFPLRDHYDLSDDEWMYGRKAHDGLTDSGDWREKIDLLHHRYMMEDTRLGLSLLWSVAGVTHTSVPLVDAFLSIGSAICGMDFRTHGRTLHDVGLGGLDRDGLLEKLQRGFA